MRPIRWDEPGLTWDNPNLRWGDPSYLLEPGDPGYVPPAAPPSPPPKRPKQPKHTRMSDFIPRSYKNLAEWLALQSTELTSALGTTLGMTAQERTDYLAACAALAGPAGVIVERMQELEELTADFEALRPQWLPAIRAAIARAKTSSGYTPGAGEALEWVGDPETFDPQTARPTINAEAQRGQVKISGRKPGFEAVNIYFRKKGDVQWTLIAVRKRKFPFYDERPLAVAGQPEVREYMAIGVNEDEEIGQTSEIREVVFAG